MCVKNPVGSDKVYRIKFRKLNPLLKGLKTHKKTDPPAQDLYKAFSNHVKSFNVYFREINIYLINFK